MPSSTKSDITWVQFNDIDSLQSAFAVLGDSVAALMIEPLVEVLATAEWLQAARALCDAYGTVLIFDEVKTAFRVRTGGVQALYGIEPDLTTLGKALANGYPLSALVGRAAVMHAATQTWISSTAAAERTGLAAANAVLDLHDRLDVCARLSEIGRTMKRAVIAALETAPTVAIRTEGEAVMWRLVADNPADLDMLVAHATRHGVLLKRGAYQFAALAHDDEAIHGVQQAVTASLRDIVA